MKILAIAGKLTKFLTIMIIKLSIGSRPSSHFCKYFSDIVILNVPRNEITIFPTKFPILEGPIQTTMLHMALIVPYGQIHDLAT